MEHGEGFAMIFAGGQHHDGGIDEEEVAPRSVEVGMFEEHEGDRKEDRKDQEGIFETILPEGFPGKGYKGKNAGPDDEWNGDQHQLGQVVPGQEVGPLQPAFEDLADGGGELRHHLVGFQEAGDGIQQDVGPEQDAEQVGTEQDQSDFKAAFFEEGYVDLLES